MQEKKIWLERQLQEHAKRIPLADGQTIPVLGKEYALCHTGGRGVITIEDNRILVPGDADFMGRRLRDWLKRRLRAEITALASGMTQRIEKPLKRISLRDTISRWGSCSHKGDLSFSWRLVFAPHEVLAYVVAHEVAHMRHPDHSPAFWQQVEALHPGHERLRDWLKIHGYRLYAYV